MFIFRFEFNESADLRRARSIDGYTRSQFVIKEQAIQYIVKRKMLMI